MEREYVNRLERGAKLLLAKGLIVLAAGPVFVAYSVQDVNERENKREKIALEHRCTRPITSGGFASVGINPEESKRKEREFQASYVCEPYQTDKSSN